MPVFDANVFDSNVFDAFEATYTLDFTAGSYLQTGNNPGLTYSGDAANYTITVSAGSYSQTGNAIALSKTFNLTFSAESYAQTGNAIGLSKGYGVNFSAGVYAQTGNAIALTKNFLLNFTAGVYSQTGSDFELLAAQSETFYLNFIIDLLPEPSDTNLFGQRLTVDAGVSRVWYRSSYDDLRRRGREKKGVRRVADSRASVRSTVGRLAT